MMTVSTNYQELTPREAAVIAAKYDGAWDHPEIPLRQLQVVEHELAELRLGRLSAPYRALIESFHRIEQAPFQTVLEVGAASCYNGRVLKEAGWTMLYTGLERSPHFQALAERIYPLGNFLLGDAREIPLIHQFDIVLHGGCLLHIFEYEKAIAEAVRVSRRYVILHRTPIQHEPTSFFLKDAYGVRCLEIHFQESELYHLFMKHRLDVIATVDVEGSNQRNYVLQKSSGLMHHPV